MKTVNFKNHELYITKNTYGINGNTCLNLIDVVDNEPYMTATTNLKETKLAENHVAIKNYSENEGILDELIVSNIISEPIYYIEGHLIDIPVCMLLI